MIEVLREKVFNLFSNGRFRKVSGFQCTFEIILSDVFSMFNIVSVLFFFFKHPSSVGLTRKMPIIFNWNRAVRIRSVYSHVFHVIYRFPGQDSTFNIYLKDFARRRLDYSGSAHFRLWLLYMYVLCTLYEQTLFPDIYFSLCNIFITFVVL